MTKSMEKEFSLGKTAENTKDIGLKDNRTEKEFSEQSTEKYMT